MRTIGNAIYVSGDEVGRGEAQVMGFDQVLQHCREIKNLTAENTVILDADSPLFGDKQSLADCVRSAVDAGAVIAIHTRNRRAKGLRELRRQFPLLPMRSSLRKLHRLLFPARKVVRASVHFREDLVGASYG